MNSNNKRGGFKNFVIDGWIDWFEVDFGCVVLLRVGFGVAAVSE